MAMCQTPSHRVNTPSAAVGKGSVHQTNDRIEKVTDPSVVQPKNEFAATHDKDTKIHHRLKNLHIQTLTCELYDLLTSCNQKKKDRLPTHKSFAKG